MNSYSPSKSVTFFITSPRQIYFIKCSRHKGKIHDFCRPFLFSLRGGKILKEEMYNTMNSYYKYTSIPKSSFYKMNILILPINTEGKYLKYSYNLPYFVTISHYESNKIKFNFLIILFGKMSSSKSLPLSEIERMTDFEKFSL